MLVRLYGRNFRSLKDDFELSMVAADLTRAEDRARGVVEVPIKGMDEPLGLLRCAAIYGPNGAGKSTVLMAGQALRWLGTESSLRSKPDAAIPPYEPFLLDGVTKGAPILLGCDVVHNNGILRYEIEYDADAIRRETLTVLSDDREKLLIDRKPSGETVGGLIRSKGANRLYVKEMQPNVSVLSKLAQHGPQKGNESARPYYRAIRNATRFADYATAASHGNRFFPSTKTDRFGEDAEYREWIMTHLIRAADVGIRDVRTREEPLSLKWPESVQEEIAKSAPGFRLPETELVVTFTHEGATAHEINFDAESSGTKKLFYIADDWWRLAHEPVTLFADELGASMHPVLLDQIVRSVNEPPTGQVASQLIFTAHDAGLLEGRNGLPPALRRDQVYFTKKSHLGATELYSLTEFKDDARPVHNLRKRYLSGLYGALPSVEALNL